MSRGRRCRDRPVVVGERSKCAPIKIFTEQKEGSGSRSKVKIKGVLEERELARVSTMSGNPR